MITFVGDVHGKIWDLWYFVNDVSVDDDHTWIQIGDIGLWPHTKNSMPKEFGNEVYWIDGNHEYFPDISDKTEIYEMVPNFKYVPRGTILEIQGHTIGFLGGGESIDKHLRVEGYSWWKDESITYKDMMQFPVGVDIDILVTHVPPMSIVEHMCNGPQPTEWNISSRAVEQVWDGFNRPPLVCGHMHRSFEAMNVHVLDINELMHFEDGNFEREYKLI